MESRRGCCEDVTPKMSQKWFWYFDSAQGMWDIDMVDEEPEPHWDLEEAAEAAAVAAEAEAEAEAESVLEPVDP